MLSLWQLLGVGHLGGDFVASGADHLEVQRERVPHHLGPLGDRLPCFLLDFPEAGQLGW